MSQQSIVKDKIEINAPAEKVWAVLTKPEFIGQWDELPENYGSKDLERGSTIEWEGYSKVTVTGFEPTRKLRLSLYLPRVALKPTEYDVSYTYDLTASGNKTILEITIGDFSPLPNPKDYYDNSVAFAQTVKAKIKELAEAN